MEAPKTISLPIPVTNPLDPTIQETHKKQLSTMRGWLEGRRYWKAMDALHIVRELSDGVRKDGITPEFHHQLSVTRLLTTLESSFMLPEETITAGFLHDLLEDKGDIWTQKMLEDKFGSQVAEAVWILSKKSNGLVKTSDSYYGAVAKNPISSLVKAADRNHNLQTMQGVFTKEKQIKYIEEVDKYYFPMIKEARHLFPRQYPAYENLKILLRCQCRLIRHIHAASTAPSSERP